MLHHAGSDEDELQLGVYDGSYIEGEDYVDLSTSRSSPPALRPPVR